MCVIKIKSKNEVYNVYVDEEDLELINNYRWNIIKTGKYKVPYVYGYLKSDLSKKIYMHRLIMNPPKGLFVDHKNHNGLDNRKSNLRICTRVENARNRRSRKGSTSKYLGVSRHNYKKKPWIAHIKYDGVVKHIGYFKTEKEAAIAYNKVAKAVFKEYCNLNKV